MKSNWMNNILKLIMVIFWGFCFWAVVLHVIVSVIASNDMTIYTICEILDVDFKKCIYLSYLVGALYLFVVILGMLIPKIRDLGSRSFHCGKDEIISSRDYSVDILKGLLIIFMIVGHSSEIVPIKPIIYSVHMPAFVIMSGYFYKKREVKQALIHLMKAFLIPYIIFACVDFLFKIVSGEMNSIVQVVSKYILGMSFPNKWFVDVESVGPVYFVLVLFGVRLIYIFIDNLFYNDILKILACLGISWLGMTIGVNGYWLPWSFDCAMFAVIFYLIGYYLKKYQLLKKLMNMPCLYFIFMTFWGYAIYNSRFEIAFRIYNPFLLVIIGATCGTILLYMLSYFLCQNLPSRFVKVMSYIGSSTLYILIVHTLYRTYIEIPVGNFLNPKMMYSLILGIFIQVSIAIIIRLIVEKVNAKNSSR